MKTIALIIAGGTGARMKQDIPKQFLTVNEKPVIVYTLEAFQNHPEIDSIAVVCVEGWEQVLRAYAKQFFSPYMMQNYPYVNPFLFQFQMQRNIYPNLFFSSFSY